MNALRDILLVGCGSFFGGAARFLVAKALPSGGGAGFPWATFAVNVAGSAPRHERRAPRAAIAAGGRFW